MRLMLGCLCAVIWLPVLLGCRTLDNEQTTVPKITREMPLEEAYDAAIKNGAETLVQVKGLARDRQQLPLLQQLSEKDLLTKNESLDPSILTNVAHLYRFSSQKLSVDVFLTLIQSREETAREIGWRLASLKPSPEIAKAMDNFLNVALTHGREDDILSPDMAKAIQENSLKSAFTFLVRGLMVQGNPEYAAAMLALDPQRSTAPFFDYLAKADLEDLRQLNQKSVNVYTCTVIFRFLLENPLPMNHPGVPQLFAFAVSRNRALAEMAYAVLEKHIPDQRNALAFMLSRLPAQVQVAFVENSQQEETANLRLLLDELKDYAQQKEVLEELNAKKPAVVR